MIIIKRRTIDYQDSTTFDANIALLLISKSTTDFKIESQIWQSLLRCNISSLFLILQSHTDLSSALRSHAYIKV